MEYNNYFAKKIDMKFSMAHMSRLATLNCQKGMNSGAVEE